LGGGKGIPQREKRKKVAHEKRGGGTISCINTGLGGGHSSGKEESRERKKTHRRWNTRTRVGESCDSREKKPAKKPIRGRGDLATKN